ncbi:MAG: response regulator [Ferruginibacter sp.]
MKPIIYVVDDSIDFLEVFSSILRRNRFYPVLVDSQNLLFENLQTTSPDLFLIDVKFGHNDGRTLCRNLKLKYGLKETPIILISANHQSLEDYEEYLADDFLEKPFGFATFLTKANALLNVVV